MPRFVFFLLLLCHSAIAAAQFNDSVTHFLHFGASGNINKANSSTAYLFNNDARFSIKQKKFSLNTSAGWVYGTQDSVLTNNDFTATLDFNLFSHLPDFYYWGLANYTTSYSLKIHNQLQSGLGAAYNFINTPKAWVNVSEGIIYETSGLTTSPSQIELYQTFRNSARLSFRFVIKDVLIVNGSNFLQNSLSNGSDYIIRSTTGLSFKLYKWLSIGSAVNYNNFRRTNTDNLLVTYGLTAEKYF